LTELLSLQDYTLIEGGLFSLYGTGTEPVLAKGSNIAEQLVVIGVI
jgi:hypothetical protein